MRSAACTASSSTPRSSTRRAAREILRNFVVDIAGRRADLDAGDLRRDDRRRHRASASDAARCICALSGGVDSAVAATLVHRADRRPADLHLRRPRPDAQARVRAAAHDLRAAPGHEPGHGRRAGTASSRRLAGVEDPEEKRRIIGDEFIRVFEEEAAALGEIDFLAQGTLYPDVIESTTAETKAAAEDQDPPQRRRPAGRPALQPDRAAALPVQGRGARVGAELGLPEAMVRRQPFPGPGWPSGSSARSPPSGWTPCARPTGSSSTRSRPPGCIGPCGSPSPCSRRCAASA